jgi:hypothetical protein
LKLDSPGDRHSGAPRQRVGEEAKTGAKGASGRRAKFPTVGFGENVAAMKGGSAPKTTNIESES